MNKFSLLIVFFISFSSLQAQIVNSGNLYISSGTSVYFADDYTNSGTHQNSGELHLKGDLTNNGTMTPSAGAITYFDSADATTQVIQGTSNSAKFSNLNINNAATNGESLEVSDGVGLEVSDVLHIQDNQKLRLMGSSQLVQTHTGVSTNTGQGHLLKDQDGAKNAYRYNYWSAPVQNESTTEHKYNLSTILKDGSTPDLWSPTQVAFTASKNGTSGTPIAISTRWLYKYTSGTIDPWNDNGWDALFIIGTTTPSSEANMLPAEGFCMKGTDVSANLASKQNYSFEGEANDGLYELTIGADKEYLVGNPYPSAIDADKFIDDNIDQANGNANPVIDGTLYFWDHWSINTHIYTHYGGGYATYTKTGGVAATLHAHFSSGSGTGSTVPLQYIPVGQGFVVRSSGTAGGTITFQNTQREFIEEGASSIQLKNNASKNGVSSRIRLDYQGPDSRIRHTLFAFTDGSATEAYDYGYDGEMILVGNNDMYYTIGDVNLSKPYTIQAVGMYDENARYPITIKAKNTGKHAISLQDLENFYEDLFIEDEKGQTHDLKEGDFVFFTTHPNEFLRFNLVFKPAPQPTDIQDNLNDFVSTYYFDHNIIIQNDQNMTLTGMQVYNSLGQLVLQVNDASRLSKREVYIPFNNFASTAYVIKLQAKSGTGTYKFINY